MLYVELKKEYCLSKNGTEYVKNHFIFGCSCCNLKVDIVDFNVTVLQNERIESVLIEKVDDRLVCTTIDYQIPWNYKSAINRLLQHCIKCDLQQNEEIKSI